MDTSLAEEVQQTMATLAPNRFFFMSPYRSFTTSGCFARFDEPAVNGDSPDSPFQQKLAALFADAKAQGIKNPVMVGAIPFDPRQPSSLYIPESRQSFSRRGKTDLSPPFYPQPVAERGGTPQFLNKPRLNRWLPAPPHLPPRRRSTKWCCHD